MYKDDRYIDLDGTFNFRDIGGYQVKDGRTIKKGLHFRSDQLNNLSENDLKILEKLNIKSIIDYRGEDERIDVNRNVEIPNTTTYYFEPVGDIAAAASAENVEEEFDFTNITAEQAKMIMTTQNITFVTSDQSKEAYRNMFKLMVHQENHAIVQHCRGGKDRTGYGVALIHLILGVSKEDIMEDYLLTNVYKLEKNEQSIYELYHETKNASLARGVRYFKEAQESFIYTALDLIDNKYGGIENYLINELKITKKEIDTIKSIYLD